MPWQSAAPALIDQTIYSFRLDRSIRSHAAMRAVPSLASTRLSGRAVGASECPRCRAALGPLRFGAIRTIAPLLLPDVLPLLRRADQALTLYLNEDFTARLLRTPRIRRPRYSADPSPYDTGERKCVTCSRTSSASWRRRAVRCC